MTLRQRIRFYQQLALFMRAGLPIRAGLERLKERASGQELALLSEKINAGEKIGDAFAAAGFLPFECHLVVAGERSAHLDTIFQHLSEYWSRELAMRQALPRPLYYPIIVMHLVVLILALVEFLTIPTPVVIVNLIERLATLYALGFIIYTVVRVSWSSPLMRGFWLRVPFIGGSLRTTYAYRWITVLRLEFGAGVSLYRAVGDAWRASGYVDCDRLAEEAEQAMLAKADLSTLVRQWKQLPRDWSDFIVTAEISGAFDETFKQLEIEAAEAWSLAQKQMADWLPKIAYFIVLLIAAYFVTRLMYQVEIVPIMNAENAIDNAGR
ncbi:MAG TPA: type II secretion system F family protein [Candidatus Methylacidiphilales bacterium]|jgi:type II secretory pathway component PulF|nr:type II secretion system F family protein [Candidatus Methylacidiphilales bacterium]